MIRKIKLKFGSKGKSDPLSITPGSVTIFVGSNNAGKSLLLREMENFCNHGPVTNNLILDDIDFEFSDDEIKKIIDQHKTECSQEESQQNEYVKYGKINSVKGYVSHTVNPNNIIRSKNNKNNYSSFCNYFISMFTAMFSGEARFQLIKDENSGDLKSNSTSNLMALFQDDNKREEVRGFVFEAFGKYFVIDPTSMTRLEIRLSDIPPTDLAMERSLEQKAIEFYKKAVSIKNFGDGIKVFVGLILATIVGNEKYIFIDEPEAFLHPPLASLLGKKLSDIMSKRDGNLIVATHSSYFVMGCIQSGRKVNIVRLTYDGKENSTARLLPSEKINELFKNPLLRSTNVIQALFFNNVIVTEADTDRAFYNEINERMLSFSTNESQGIKNSLFINAQNKSTIWAILKPLRELGIPTAAIFDIDILKDGGQEFTRILDAAQIPQSLRQTFHILRSGLQNKFEGKNMKKDGGIKLLEEGDQTAFEKFINDLAEYGIFIVKNGELESWLPSLECTNKHGPSWLLDIFNAMGDDPENENYLKPDKNDVWEFINSVREWFENPSRKGVG